MPGQKTSVHLPVQGIHVAATGNGPGNGPLKSRRSSGGYGARRIASKSADAVVSAWGRTTHVTVECGDLHAAIFAVQVALDSPTTVGAVGMQTGFLLGSALGTLESCVRHFDLLREWVCGGPRHPVVPRPALMIWIL